MALTRYASYHIQGPEQPIPRPNPLNIEMNRRWDHKGTLFGCVIS